MKWVISLSVCWIATFFLLSGQCSANTVPSSLVVGTLDSSRVGEASVLDGNLTDEMRASLYANFPNVSIQAAPVLTDAFLANIDMLVVTNVADEYADNWLTPSEQTAITTFVENGGSAIVFADPYFGLSAQNATDPFGVTFAYELISDFDQLAFVDPPNNPLSNGPFGTVTTGYVYYYGWFEDLGPYATTLATNDENGMPSVVSIPENAMMPGSGRVLVFADGSVVADDGIGIFTLNETMFLNGVHYLTVPEPSAVALCCSGLVAMFFSRSVRRVRGR